MSIALPRHDVSYRQPDVAPNGSPVITATMASITHRHPLAALCGAAFAAAARLGVPPKTPTAKTTIALLRRNRRNPRRIAPPP